jgi:hypothetical protein
MNERQRLLQGLEAAGEVSTATIVRELLTGTSQVPTAAPVRCDQIHGPFIDGNDVIYRASGPGVTITWRYKGIGCPHSD